MPGIPEWQTQNLARVENPERSKCSWCRTSHGTWTAPKQQHGHIRFIQLTQNNGDLCLKNGTIKPSSGHPWGAHQPSSQLKNILVDFFITSLPCFLEKIFILFFGKILLITSRLTFNFCRTISKLISSAVRFQPHKFWMISWTSCENVGKGNACPRAF